MIPVRAFEAAHAAICEQRLDDCLDSDWRGKCVKAVEAAAPYMRGTIKQEQTMTIEEAVRVLRDAGVTGENYEAFQQAVQELQK